MFEYLYQWIENLAFYIVILTAVTQMVPNNAYKKYIQFFAGIILVLLMARPVFQLFGMEQSFLELYKNTEYQQKIAEIEEATKYLEDISDEIQ